MNINSINVNLINIKLKSIFNFLQGSQEKPL